MVFGIKRIPCDSQMRSNHAMFSTKQCIVVEGSMSTTRETDHTIKL
jgi:hypothetical protein